ncbi:M1 family aminopeptidase, partial [Mucilaginibacter sp.]|uniref:M1 family aminopeptidase n=1 Tax=Mucilaginibacter sp. TaxID=1882438 RepID=UPI0035BC4669
MLSSKPAGAGLHTDVWEMTKPIQVYAVMFAAGNFSIIKDSWNGKEVNYYVEPEYAPYASKMFQHTPQMISYFSDITGVPYPWNKYDQIVVRDYVSGAMENTTASLFGEFMNQNAREIADRNYEDIVSHELSHQWFGDYATCESWSNLTVNESFADFSETLWAEYKYGKDAGDAHIYDDMVNYLSQPAAKTKNLVRFNYADKEDMFDVVTYQKGGRILYMLRNYLGNAAFYKGLNLYLTKNAFKNGEAQQLRLALEEASGKDLNWFFNQWYYGAGHPVLNITYNYDAATKTQAVYLQQTQDGDAFTLPMAIDIYTGGKKVRHNVWMRDKADTLYFPAATKPDLVNVDGDKVLLTKKTDTKTLDEYSFQYFNAPLFLDRFEAIDGAKGKQTEKAAQKIIVAAMNDKFYQLRIKAINAALLTNDDVRNAAVPVLVKLAQTDDNNLVRAAAINALGKLKASGNMNLFKQAINSQSYAIQAAALNAIGLLNPQEGVALAKNYQNNAEGALKQAVLGVYAVNGTDAEWPYVFGEFKKNDINSQFPLIRRMTDYAARVKNPAYAQEFISTIGAIGVKYKQYGVAPTIAEFLTTIKDARTKMGDTASADAADKAIVTLKN